MVSMPGRPCAPSKPGCFDGAATAEAGREVRHVPKRGTTCALGLDGPWGRAHTLGLPAAFGRCALVQVVPDLTPDQIP